MIYIILLFTALFNSNSSWAGKNSKASGSQKKIYSRHWFGPLPPSKNKKEALLIHDIFLINFNLDKNFPTWIAYSLSPSVVWGQVKVKRKYISDPLLPFKHSAKFKHYKGASDCDGKGPGYHKGHLAPLGSFKASPFIYQAQYLSNITPQTKNLNQGPWRIMEEKVRNFVKRGNELKILAGPAYGMEGKNKTPPCWKSAQGFWGEIPSAYWKIIAFKSKSEIKTCAVLMPQDIKSEKDRPKKYSVKIEDIEQKTKLSILSGIKKSITQSCDFLF